MQADSRLANRLVEYGIVPDVNITDVLAIQKKFKSMDYVNQKMKKNPRKPTEYDYLLHRYPYKGKELHEDRPGDAAAGGHFERAAPALDAELLSEATTENVFKQSRPAAAMANDKCISEAFFAGEIEGIVMLFLAWT
jgi:hypothetical protein